MCTPHAFPWQVDLISRKLCKLICIHVINIPGSWLTSVSGLSINSSPFLLQVRLRFSVSLSAVPCCMSLPPQGSRATPPEQLLPTETGSALTASSKNDNKMATNCNNMQNNWQNYSCTVLIYIIYYYTCVYGSKSLIMV